MQTLIRNREVTFAHQDDCLVRTVADPAGQRSYTHRCSKAAFIAVAHAINETPREGTGTSLIEIARGEQIAFTQANVALEFLKDRCLVDVRHRRSYPATSDVYLDAMIEWYALVEEKP